jgi:LmbE family N-acetylglucosaminyl deacetylase
MKSLSLSKTDASPLTILCLGAHSDDIEIGCGGTLLHLKRSGALLKIHWVVLSAVGRRGEEALTGAELFTAGCEKQIVRKEFRDGFLPYCGAQVKEVFEELKEQVDPDLIFTHWQGDAHQDHRMVSELTWNTFRNHLILEYEIPKYDGDMGRPNAFIPLEEPAYMGKVDNLFKAFASQQSKPWFERETFLGLMRLRGMESNAASGYAEAFYTRKLLIDPIG